MKKFKCVRILTATSSFQVEWSNWAPTGKLLISIYLLVLSRSILIIISWLNLEFSTKKKTNKKKKKILGGPIKLFTIRRQRHAIHMPLSKLICKGFEFLCGLNSPREERISLLNEQNPHCYIRSTQYFPFFYFTMLPRAQFSAAKV